MKQYPKDKLKFHGLNVGFTFEAILIAADAYRRSKSTDPKVLDRRDPADEHHLER